MPHIAPFCKGFSVLIVIHTISDSVAYYAKRGKIVQSVKVDSSQVVVS